MSDWQIGDLVVCVDASPARDLCGNGGIESRFVRNLVQGRIYEVDVIVACGCGKHTGLGNRATRAGGSTDRFRKIRPDTHEACEEEFVTLLKRKRVSA